MVPIVIVPFKFEGELRNPTCVLDLGRLAWTVSCWLELDVESENDPDVVKNPPGTLRVPETSVTMNVTVSPSFTIRDGGLKVIPLEFCEIVTGQFTPALIVIEPLEVEL